MARQIPLHQINAFEAAARRLSFSKAAQDLNVQQPAISRQVSALEADLGVTLFVRTKPRLTLTRDGEVLANAVATGFDAIRAGLETLRNQSLDDTIVVNASIGFTSLFLLPRLAEFQAAFPEIKLQLMTRDQNDDFDPETCDIVIQFGETGLAGVESRLIFKETMVALCHPDLLPQGRPFDLPALAEQKLLRLASPEHRGDWTRFFSHGSPDVPAPILPDGYVSYMVYLRAIEQGLGIGIGWYPLMAEFLGNGTLVRACDHECETTRGYFCSVTPTGAKKSGAAKFRDWVSQVLTNACRAEQKMGPAK